MAARPFEQPGNDDAAMIRLQAGDESALADIAEEWSTKLVGYFNAKLSGRDYQAAEELAQDVLIRVWDRRDQYIPGGKFRSWVFTIASRLLVDHVRHTKRRRAKATGGSDSYDYLTGIESDESDPTQDVADAEEFEHLALLVEELSPVQAAVCRDHYWSGLSLSDIAELEGVPLPTVKSRIQNGRAKLRNWLANNDDADGCDVRPATRTPRASVTTARCLIQTPAPATGPRQLSFAFGE